MDEKLRYPILDVDLGVIRNNASVMTNLCRRRGIDVAGVIKFSDGDLQIARAYHEGGCRQIASSRTVHLRRIKEAMPEVTTMLIRIPMPSEAVDVVRWCDLSLNSEESVLRALNEAAGKHDVVHGVVLMLDVGDRREGVYGEDRLLEMAPLPLSRVYSSVATLSLAAPLSLATPLSRAASATAAATAGPTRGSKALGMM